MNSSRHLRMVALPLTTIVLLAACGDASGPKTQQNKTVDVFTTGDSFSPTFATINAGDTVRWNFTPGSDGMGHNVRFTPRPTGTPADINVLTTGIATRVFTTAGEFAYVCDVHPGMNGDVLVK